MMCDWMLIGLKISSSFLSKGKKKINLTTLPPCKSPTSHSFCWFFVLIKVFLIVDCWFSKMKIFRIRFEWHNYNFYDAPFDLDFFSLLYVSNNVRISASDRTISSANRWELYLPKNVQLENLKQLYCRIG